MKKIIIIGLSVLFISGCLGRNQTITAKDANTGISVTGSKDEITIEGTMKLEDGTEIEIKNVEE